MVKTLKKCIILAAIAVGLNFLFSSCTRELPSNGETSIEKKLHLPELLNDTYMGGIKLPNGTRTSLNEEGGVNFDFPVGIVYAGFDDIGGVSLLTKGCYSCTSTCKDGCDVVKLGDDIGCSRCKNSTADCTGKDCGSDQLMALNEGGFVNLNSGIRFITLEEAESFENLIAPTVKVLLQIPEVQKEIETFYQSVWGDNSPEEGNYDEALIDLFGSKATFFIPRNHQSEGARIEGIITCSCTSGTSGCTLEEIKKLGQVIGHKCKAGACTTCQMNYPEK